MPKGPRLQLDNKLLSSFCLAFHHLPINNVTTSENVLSISLPTLATLILVSPMPLNLQPIGTSSPVTLTLDTTHQHPHLLSSFF